MKIVKLEHIDKWVVRSNGSYLEFCTNLGIYILGTAHVAKTFKTEEDAKEAIQDYKKYK